MYPKRTGNRRFTQDFYPRSRKNAILQNSKTPEDKRKFCEARREILLSAGIVSRFTQTLRTPQNRTSQGEIALRNFIRNRKLLSHKDLQKPRENHQIVKCFKFSPSKYPNERLLPPFGKDTEPGLKIFIPHSSCFNSGI